MMAAALAEPYQMDGARLRVNVDKRLREWAGPIPVPNVYPEQSLMYRVMREREAALIRSSSTQSDGGLAAICDDQGRLIEMVNRIRELNRLIQQMPAEYQAVVVVRYVMKVYHRKAAAEKLGWTLDRWRITKAKMEGWLEARL